MEPNAELTSIHDSESGESQPSATAASDAVGGATCEPASETARVEPDFDAPSDRADARGNDAPPVELASEPEPAPRLETQDLIPWFSQTEDPPRLESAAGRAKWRFDPVAIAAGIAALGLVGIGGLAAYDHMRQSAAFAVKAQETQDLAANVNLLKSRLDAIEAARAHEEIADLHKVLGEIKAGASATQGFGASLAQLTARVDRVEKDQGARFDKLGERIDRDAAARFADIAARIDKLEKKAAAPAVAATAPVAPQKPASAPLAGAPNVSNETTGSIEKPKPLLRGYALDDIRDGEAMIDGRDGPLTVAPGDVIPGAGRVLRFEKRGREWVVVTTLGIIGTDPEGF